MVQWGAVVSGRLRIAVGLSDAEVGPVAEKLRALAGEGPAGAVFARLSEQLEHKRRWRPMRAGDVVTVAKGAKR